MKPLPRLFQNRFRIYLLLVLPLAGVTFMASAQAQPKQATHSSENIRSGHGNTGSTGNVPTICGTVLDSLTSDPLPGAHVEAITPSDTLYTITDRQGAFAIPLAGNNSSTWPLRLKISFIGYQTIGFRFRDAGSLVPLTVKLVSTALDIDKITIKGRVQMITQKGDTLEYNPRAVRSMQGDNVKELLQSFPGVEVKDKSITANGKQVEVVYVDGRLVFGSDIMDPLYYIDASDVDRIRLYTEARVPHRRRERTVMDIITFSKLTGTMAGETLLSAGNEMEKNSEGEHRIRYGAGGSFNIFAERNVIKLSAITSNIDRQSSKMADITNLRSIIPKAGIYNNTAIDASYEHNDMERGIQLDVNYNYGRDKETEQEEIRDDYYATNEWTARLQYDTLLNNRLKKRHQAKIYCSTRLDTLNRFRIDTRIEGNLEDNCSGETQASLGLLDGGVLSRQYRLSSDTTRGRSLSGELSFHYDTPSRRRKGGSRSLSLSIHFLTSNDDTDRNSVDTLASSTSHTYVTSNAGGCINNFRSTLNYSETLGQHASLDFSYNLDRNNSRYNRIAMDNLTFQIDPTLSERYVDNRLTHKISAGTSLRFRRISATIGILFESTELHKTNGFFHNDIHPEMCDYGRVLYNSLLPNLNFRHIGTRGNIFTINYYATANYPSADRLCPTLDSYDPYRLIAGNPALQPERVHSLMSSYTTTIPALAASLQLQLEAKITTDKIASRTEYLLRDTLLTAYGDYPASAGANLITTTNAGTDYNVKMQATYSFLFRPIRSIVSFIPAFSFFRSPTYIGTEYNRSDLYYPSLTVSIRTNFSSLIRLNLHSATVYAVTRNSVTTNVKTFSEQVSATATCQFAKRWYFYANYLFRYYDNISYPDNDNSQHQFNAAIGMRIFKNRMGDIALAAYDLFNDTRSFTASVRGNLIRNRWILNYGRYVTLNFSYRFNRKSTAAQENAWVRMLQ